MKMTRIIRFAALCIIVALLLFFMGTGNHQYSLYSVLMVMILAPLYFKSMETSITYILTLFNRERFVLYRLTWIEIISSVTIPMMFAVTFYIHWNMRDITGITPLMLYSAIAGAVIVCTGLIVSFITIMTWGTMFVGHGIEKEHKMITRGIYSRVRHPIYLADHLFWIGLSLGTLSIVSGVLTAVYVIPVYYLYMRAEEKMMIEHFGDEYRDYMDHTGMLLPSLR
jgi:protein-S-isoprenylcysteine O-methyltransferase Ste14